MAAALATRVDAVPDDKSHVHADVFKGQLVFTRDNASDAAAAAHVSGNEPEISMRETEPSRKVVPTAAALEMLKRRATP